MSAPVGARLRALVVEDEWPARDYLVELLHATGRAEVIGAVGTLTEARQLLARRDELGPVDVVFADVQLGAGADDGMRLVRELATAPAAPCIVLATAFDRHAVEAFALGVADYLLKPFSEERVEQCLERVTSRRAPPSEPRGPSRLVARSDKGLVFLDREEVWAFEAAGRLTFVHAPLGRFDLDLSLAAIEGALAWGLTRVHRNWLVDLRHVREMKRDGGETQLLVGRAGADGGLWIPVARERAPRVRDMLLADAAGIRK